MATDTAARLSLIDLFLLGDLTSERLGDAWTKSDDNTDHQAVEFHHTEGHAIGIRRLWDGIGAQTFLTSPNHPRYNAGVVFSDTEGASDTLINAIEQRLLPSLDGHRPKLGSNGAPIPPPQEAPAAEPAPETVPQQPAPPAPQTAQPATPEPEKAAPRTKKAPPRRPATTAPKRAARKPKATAATV
ncbi:hypothetical protein ACFWBH_03220 [Streptomyces sp. NPDC059999]|uniref:hypothetical protein n=1 Tax=Streptomyces sp. NPDC059999 TaxID=3347030 RepID=UPI00368AD219